MQARHRQRGIGLLSLMTYIGAGGFAVYTAFALLPVYMEYIEVRSSVDSLRQGVSESDLNARRLKDLLLRWVAPISWMQGHVRHDASSLAHGVSGGWTAV